MKVFESIAEICQTERVFLGKPAMSRCYMETGRGIDNMVTSRVVVMTSRGVVMTSRGVVMTSRGVVMTSRDRVYDNSYHLHSGCSLFSNYCTVLESCCHDNRLIKQTQK